MSIFSVIITAYNSENTIRNCLDSVIRQSFSNFEVVVINDGSQDHTKEIISSYALKDSRIKLYNFENAGISVSRSRGIVLANGDYYIFVDSDDTINPELLNTIYQTTLRYNKPDIIRFQAALINDASYKDHNRYNFFDPEKDKLTGMEALKTWSLPDKKYSVYWIYAFRKFVFSNILTFPNLRCYEDVALIPLLIAKSQKIVTIDYVGYNYTYNNPNSLTHSKHYEGSRAVDFVNAYNFAITNFKKIDNLSPFDLAFFVEYYNSKLRIKFNSLTRENKEKLSTLFGF